MSEPAHTSRRPATTLACAVALMVSAVISRGGDWPTWRGPGMIPVAPDADPPTTFSETENVRWKVDIPGRGHGTPVIWGTRLMLQTAIPSDNRGQDAPPQGGPSADGEYQFDVLCLDRNTGKILWQKTACRTIPHEGHHRDHGFASASPTTDGTRVWASFGSRGIYCFDMQGKLQWRRDLGRVTQALAGRLTEPMALKGRDCPQGSRLRVPTTS